MNDNIRALLRQVKCDRAAQALARAGNQRDFSYQAGRIQISGRHRQI